MLPPKTVQFLDFRMNDPIISEYIEGVTPLMEGYFFLDESSMTLEREV
jgi:hypothetical protein